MTYPFSISSSQTWIGLSLSAPWLCLQALAGRRSMVAPQTGLMYWARYEPPVFQRTSGSWGYINTPDSLTLRWDNPEVCFTVFWSPQLPTDLSYTLTHCIAFLHFPVSLSLSPTGASQDQLPYKWLALKYLFQGRLLGKLNLLLASPNSFAYDHSFFSSIFPYPGTTSPLVPWKVWHGSQIYE